MEEDRGKVCVTGGTGFVASWLIMRLLQHGYSVNTTIRPDPDHKRDVSFLTSLGGAKEKLHIFEADLNIPSSFDAAIEGCIGVFHVATPVDFENKEPEEVIIKRVVDGTLGILNACLNSTTVKKVVYTSSASAVSFTGKEDVDIVDETHWTDADYVRSVMSWGVSYFVSKTLTEKAVLEFADKHGLDLVTVVPSYIVGPFICSKFPGSVHTALAMFLGEKEQYRALINISMVHTDDVARAHILLFENPEAKGRFTCSSHTLTIDEMSNFLSKKYPGFPIPTPESLKEVKGYRSPGVSSKKLMDSGFEFKYGLDEMFDDAIQCCKEKGYLSTPSPN